MKKFIQENWFKIIVTIVILIIGISIGYYFVIYMPKYQEKKLLEQKNEQTNNNSFLYQEKCAEASVKFYNKFMQDSTKGISDGYISHYNKSLNKCFIELSSEIGNMGIVYELADAIEGTEYGEINWTIPNEDNAGWCILYPSGNGVGSNSKNCNSKTEFDNFVKPYMND